MLCAACGHENRLEARFCDACGTALGPYTQPQPQPRSYTPAHLAQKILTTRAALEGERKQVSVLFCDLTDSTKLAQRLGPERMHDTLNAFFDLAMAEVHRLEGTINQFLGDGFMALFGAPLAHEDHVRRALLCALAIQQRLHAAAAETNGLLQGVVARIGINTGPVVVGRIGDNLRMDYTAIGDTTNVAARLQSTATPGTVCVGESVHAIGQAFFEFRALGPRALKGIATPVAAFELLRPFSAPAGDLLARSLGVAAPMVGRDSELSLATQAVAELSQGRGGVLVVSGEPGAGKSRLGAELRRQPVGAGVRWLEGRALSFGRHLSYWPFIEILKTRFDIGEDDAEELSLRKLRDALTDVMGPLGADMLPYLAKVLVLQLDAEHEERVKYLDGPGLKRQVFLSMRQLFEQLAKREPVALMLEDWHWADQSSIELADHLLPLTQECALLVCMMSRTEPIDTAKRVQQLSASFTRSPPRFITVASLSPADSEALLLKLVGPSALPPALRAQILRRTEGNPLFLEEVVRSLVSQGALVRHADNASWQLSKPVDEMQIPDTLQGLILARIDRLDEDAKQALKLASVIGRSFFDRVLAAISDARVELHQRLAELQQAELIREKERLPELEYIFKHALVQEAAYGSILLEQRRAIHQRVALAIEAIFPDRLDEFSSLLAHHFTLAEDWGQAQTYLFKAGDLAGRMAADVEALELLRHAEEAYLKAHGDKLQPMQRAALARKVGAALYGTGQYEAAHEQFRNALAQLGVIYPTTRGGVLGAALRALGAHLWRTWRRALGVPAKRRLDLAVATEISTVAHMMAWMDYFLDKERLLLDSLIELDAGENSEYRVAEARGLSTVGFAMMTFGARKLARRYHRRALNLAEQSGNVPAIAFAWLALAVVDFWDGAWDQFETHIAQSAKAYRECGDLHGWSSPAMQTAWVDIARGRLEQARSQMAAMVQLGRDSADPLLCSWGLQVLGHALTITGPLTQAEAALAEGRVVAERIHSVDNLVHILALHCNCLLLLGRIDECEPLLEEGHAIVKRERMNRDFDRAELLTSQARYLLARAEAASGETRQAALAKALTACRIGVRCARHMPLWLPATLRLQASADWLRGDAAKAQRGWQESLKVAADSAFPIERGLTLLDMGSRTSDLRLVKQATDLFRQTGAHTYLALAEQQLQGSAGSTKQAALQVVA